MMTRTYHHYLSPPGTAAVAVALFVVVVVWAAQPAWAQEQVSFDPAQNYGAGSGPFSVTSGDFDGDGVPDLAVANISSDDVSVLLGAGDGIFGAPQDFAAGTNPTSVTSGDFDGDGVEDLAVANVFSDDVSVLLGAGNGTFGAAQNFGAGDAPVSVTSADFDGDGVADLAVANGNSNNVSVLLGAGDGTFGAPQNFGAGSGPRSVSSGDFDGDGVADLAVANAFSDNVSVLLGAGDGTFGAAQNYGAGDVPFSVTSGDFDDDGVADLAVANVNSNNVSVLLGAGDGTFGAPQNFGAGSGPRSVSSGDFDDDGVADLAVANGGSDNVSVLLGAGDGTFAAPQNFGAGDSPQSVTSGDFDGDGVPDLAVANQVSNNVSILLNNRPPVAINDPYTVTEDQTLTVDAPGVLANDTDDANGDDLTATVVTGPQNASSFSLNPDGSFSYTPNTNFEGTDAFTYKANDGTQDSNEATVVISVLATNDPPTANDDTDQTEKNTPLRINVLSNDLDIDGDRLTVTSASDPQNGTTTINTDNTVTYTPDEDYVSQSGSPDTFTYTIDDPSGLTDTATVSVEVGDTGAPSVVSVSPTNATDTASADTKVKATFSENIDPATLDESTFTLVKDGTTNPVSATVTLDSSGKKATLDPTNPLKPNTTYTATIKGGVGGVADLSGNELTGDEVWFFSVNSAPQITNPRPSPDSQVRTPRPTIQATVTDAQTDLRARNITLSVDGTTISSFKYNGRIDRVEYKPGSDLTLGNHRVRISAVDAQGLRTTRTWTFEVVQ